MRMNHYKLPAGVQDLLPEEYYNVSLLTEKLKNKFRLAGCRFLESSAVEYYDTFAEIRNRIPQRQMFKMTDGDGSLLVLRPDMTLAVARMAATMSATASGASPLSSETYHSPMAR